MFTGIFTIRAWAEKDHDTSEIDHLFKATVFSKILYGLYNVYVAEIGPWHRHNTVQKLQKRKSQGCDTSVLGNTFFEVSS